MGKEMIIYKSNICKTSEAGEKQCDYFGAPASGIIDPVKVVRCALQNAASIAGLLMTTEAIVTEILEREKSLPGNLPAEVS